MKALLRRAIREAIKFHQTESHTKSYWHTLKAGSTTYSSSIRPNPRESAWHAQNHPPVRALLKDIQVCLDERCGERLVEQMGAASRERGSQFLRIAKILNSSVVAAETGRCSPYNVRTLADELMRQLTGDTYDWRFVVPLEGIQFKPGTLSTFIGPQSRLRVLELPEREFLVNADMLRLSSQVQGSIIRSHVALEHVIAMPLDGDLTLTRFQELEDESKLFATVLSTLSGQDIRLAGYFASPALAYPMTIPFSYVPGMPIYESLKNPLMLDRSAARRAMKLVTAATNGPNARVTRIARSRLFEIMCHHDPGDRLIDAWIALESLFLSDARSELRFRSALRIAAYGGAADRMDLYDFVRHSYDMRSTLVHGGSPDDSELKAVADRTVATARDALRRVLRLQTHFDPARIERSLLGKPD